MRDGRDEVDYRQCRQPALSGHWAGCSNAAVASRISAIRCECKCLPFATSDSVSLQRQLSTNDTEEPFPKGEKASAADEHSNECSGAYHDIVEPCGESVGNTHLDISFRYCAVRCGPAWPRRKRKLRLSASHTGKKPGRVGT